MMINGDNDREIIDVVIFTFVTKKYVHEYDGFYQALMKYSRRKITFSLHGLKSKTNFNAYPDYLIIVLHEKIYGYDKVIKMLISSRFPEPSIKIFLILNTSGSSDNLVTAWKSLTNHRFYNVYTVVQKKSDLVYSRTKIIKIEKNYFSLTLDEVSGQRFLKLKNTLKGDEFTYIQVVHYDVYPLSYSHNKVIIGPDGGLINEFSQKLRKPYQIINDNRSNPTFEEINTLMQGGGGDISLYTQVNVNTPSIKSIWTNEKEGLCFLAPRNIPVSTYENLVLPLDKETLIMALIATISVIICWKLITNDMTLASILTAVYELIFNLGASGIENLTTRENILVYCFIFSSFIMISFYESIFISFMMFNQEMRSAYSLEELNSTNTKFYTFYDDFLAKHNNLKMVKSNLVLNYVRFQHAISLEVPENLDVNLAYLVYCDYGEFFVQSKRNYDNGRRLFDKIELAQNYKKYNIQSGYAYIDEFKRLVADFMEFGLYKFWKEDNIRQTDAILKSDTIHSEDSALNEYDMTPPIVILSVGCFISFVVFIIEIAIFKWKDCCLSHMNEISVNLQTKITRKKKLKLDRWKEKYIYNKKLKAKNDHDPFTSICLKAINDKKEYLRRRECVGGNYLVLKKYKKTRKIKKLKHQIIQVRPYNEETIVETSV